MNLLDLPKSISSIKKKLGKGKLGNGKAKLFTVSGRLITDDEIDLGQVYEFMGKVFLI